MAAPHVFWCPEQRVMPTTSDVFGSLLHHTDQQSRAFVWRHMHTANSRLGVSPECVAEERAARGVVVYEIDTEQQLHHHERFLACRLQTSVLGVVQLKALESRWPHLARGATCK